LSPRRFEELIAEILKEMGFEVKLTPATRDGGRDVFAYFNTPVGKLLTIVECKRYLPGNNVGIDVVERFLWTINEKDKASCGLIITTSQFTKGALALQKEYAWRLQLKAYEDLHEWLCSLNADFSYSKDKRYWIQNYTKPTANK
jgi:restriction system protein